MSFWKHTVGLVLILMPICLLASDDEKKNKSAPEPPWVQLGKDGRLKYRTDNQGNRIPDFSMVGYETGNVPLPGMPGGVVVPTKITLEPTEGDQTQRIQDAIDQLAKLPIQSNGYRGALLLKRGEYPCSGTIKLNASGIVLRGMGDDLTTGTILRDTGKKRDPFVLITGSGKMEFDKETEQPVIDDYVPVGSFTLKLKDAARYKVGDTVIVERASTAEWMKLIQADRAGVDWPITFPVVRADRVIQSINGNTITLDAPIVTAIEAKYGGAKVTRYRWPGRVHHVGVEKLIGFSNHKDTKDEDHAWRFIQVQSAEHVFIHDVTGQHFAYAAVNFRGGSKWATALDVKCLDPVSTLDGARRYSFCNDGQLCLMKNCYARGGRHDFVANDYIVTGPNVFVDCVAEKAYTESGPHRHWTSGMLFDNMKTNERLSLYHRKNYGRKEKMPPYHLGHGWASANCVAWNCTIGKALLVESPPGANNWAIGCKAASFTSSGPERGAKKQPGQFESNDQPHVIRSLYEAQLAERKKNTNAK